MTIRDDLLTAARDLVIALSSATDDKVINADIKGPRPELPYVTVRVTTPGGSIGQAERLDGLDVATSTIPTTSMELSREASISYQGFGRGSLDWFDDLESRLDDPTSLAQQETSGISALLISAATDISLLLDTEIETRYSMDLQFRYKRRTTPVEQLELLTVDIDIDLERFDGDPDILNADFTVDLT